MKNLVRGKQMLALAGVVCLYGLPIARCGGQQVQQAQYVVQIMVDIALDSIRR